MRLAKFLVIIILLLLTSASGVWYYITNQVANELNSKYADQKFAVQNIDKKNYFISFKNVTSSGFPFKISWNLNSLIEESKTTKITYSSPINFGYDLLSQKIFINYTGEVDAKYKPEKSGFGARLKITDYSIKIDLPLSADLINTLKNMTDPIEVINHIGDINLSSKKVEIFDKIDNTKFYDKEFERLKLTFKAPKQYKDLKDLLTNIPKHYTLDYVVKTHPTKAESRILPVSLFYGFSLLPSDIDMNASTVIKTKANKIEELKKNIEVNANITCNSQFFSIKDFKLDFKSNNTQKGQNYSLDTNSKIHFKEGMFNYLFANYNNISSRLASSSAGNAIHREIQYIISNKDKFKFKDLEKSDYDLNLKMNSYYANNKLYLKLNDFSILSEDSGIKLQNEMEIANLLSKKKKWFAKGLLYMKNYPSVIDFSSRYIYRFGKFRFLSEEARKLYIDTNTGFLRKISDHPESTSNDISFEYSIDSKNINKAKFGSARLDQIKQLYMLGLYKNLFDKVGTEGDVLSKMQEIIPNIDKKDPILQQLLPKISNSGKNLEKSIKKEINKIVPAEAQNLIKNFIPKKQLEKNDLLKNFIK